MKKFPIVIGFLGFSLLCSICLMAFILNISGYGISIVAIASTLFIVLREPKGISYKKLVGSYLVATIASFAGIHLGLGQNITTGFSVTMAVIFMTLLDLQHPPAVGIALAFSYNEFSLFQSSCVLIGVFLLIYLAKAAKHVCLNPKDLWAIFEEKSLKRKIIKGLEIVS